MRSLQRPLIVSLAVCAAGLAHATDTPITGLKLVVVDKTTTAGKAKVTFVAKDVGVTKGSGTDPAQVEAALGVSYDSSSGVFNMWSGLGWVMNSAGVAKYLEKTAPLDGAVKVSTIKTGSLVKVVAKSLGDIPLDISAAPTGTVYVADTIVNGGDTTRLCTQFTGCLHKTTDGGTGYKLICRDGTGDPSCTAAVPPPGPRFVDQGLTVLDKRTGLEWEKKTTAVGSGVNAADLQDVDNQYSWAGVCSTGAGKECQPTPAAEASCKAHTPAPYWTSGGCEQCTGGEGTCNVDQYSSGAITTVWDWLNQVNAANYAGHNDWRLPSESGCNSCYVDYPWFNCGSCGPHELEAILLSPYPCALQPCIEATFGPTASDDYWSSSTSTEFPNHSWTVNFNSGPVSLRFNPLVEPVRAVRGGS